MKRKTKLGLGLGILTLGILALSGCTASFCSDCDSAHMLYAYDNGVTKYYDTDSTDPEHPRTKLTQFTNPVYADVNYENNTGAIVAINKTAMETNFIEVPTLEFWAALDSVVLQHAMTDLPKILPAEQQDRVITTSDNAETINYKIKNYGGYLKFSAAEKVEEKQKVALWDNFDVYIREARSIVGNIDECPTTDYIALYKKTLNQYLTTNRACIATKEGQYGNYGYTNENKTTVLISAKTYQYGWSKGFLEGLLIWPIGALVDVLCVGLGATATGNGWAQLLSIVIVTILIRGIIFACTFKQTAATAKMTELQPEITKIQNKYPSSNTNSAEKQRMAQEMQALYKKNKINPFGSIIVMIIQFPVFICVWGALSGSAWLATGSFCNLNLSDSISSALFNQAAWGTGAAETALVLFLLMAAAQVVSMLLPQWMQKRKAKSVAKLGKNPSQNSQNNKMKWVTYIMMIMIIVMGFSLASAMGVYWLIGALFSIAQTLLTQYITARKAKKEKSK